MLISCLLMTCQSCGAENPEGSTTCSSCQAAFETTEENLKRATRWALGVALAFLTFWTVVIGLLEPRQ